MHTGTGIGLIVAGAALLIVTALVLRRRFPRSAVDVLAGVSGAVVAVGGLLLLHGDVSTASWVAAPAVLALASVAHLRVLFGGTGPFRT